MKKLLFFITFLQVSYVFGYSIKSYVISSGATECTSLNYVLNGQVAQVSGSSGWLKSSSYKGIIGFWHPYTAILNKTKIEESNLSGGLYRNFLYEAHPNPAHDKLEIRYSIEKRGHVKLALYNVAGQEVKTLVNRECEAGEYRVIWDFHDVQKDLLPQGVYFYSIEMEDFKQAKKVMIFR